MLLRIDDVRGFLVVARWVRLISILRRWAPFILVAAVAARLAWIAFVPNATNFLDLHVYVDGAAEIVSGDLYAFRYSANTPEFPLPFTYPPFAALVFFPLSLLPFGFVAVAWQLGTVAALFGVVRICQQLMLGSEVAKNARYSREAMLWTAVGMWSEPVRTTLDYGQINVFLVLLIMVAVRSSRWWVSGLLVGVAAGIKLTPAIAGLYFVAQRRYLAAAFSAVVFFGTVGVSWVLIRDETREYIRSYFGDADRIGPVASVWNQSVFGAVHRFGVSDNYVHVVWGIAVVVCVVAAFVAWRSLASGDKLGVLLVVQLLGLLISPVSWSHHWVWVLPLVLWLVYGPFSGMRGARGLAIVWGAAVMVGVPWLLSFQQDTIWTVVDPPILVWFALVYVVGALTIFGWMVWCGRRGSLTLPAGPDSVSLSSR
ncbi:polyprenol-phosphate-mannose-dependent alpha-(1-2)-phosphatidylinositol pentamannoside mannosyltransferase [Hoyosella rhizosphaerae]|uniref:Polyprenol-phosphate-mannose-dependent alpha-(1-2)-phosphatidylinositol pentamannoside mannosyltransferase n=1 Tax=Hoyosella rhizosphaerae TaxID=1755582 RepID=A0A916XFZ2_9ACTN|nr:polyprenol-phosphate-mannose-dependent alpha-(1-2)-phosphatidylinositol pentamannoside mannosyltransferase [Hoyosella rhizosphaerae]